MKKKQTTRVPGIRVSYKMQPSNLEIINIAIHQHSKDDKSDCPFKIGLELTLFNFVIGIGLWEI